jgi:4-hydroxybutyrate CoA-transferase
MSWIDQYRSKLVTAHEAMNLVESGMRVYIHPGCAEPEALVEALISRSTYVKDVEILHLMTMGTSPYCAPEMADSFRHNALFVGGNVREAVNAGRADYTPIFLSEVEALFESGEMPIDVAFIQVSPPDPHGYCSFGVGVECTLTAAKFAHKVIAQVNAQMPRTYGDSLFM